MTEAEAKADETRVAAHASIGALELIQLRTADPAATAEWYRDVLGATVQMTSPFWSRVRLGNVDIGIHESAVGREAGASAGWEPAFRVHDIAATRATLEAHGVAITQDYHDIPGGVKLGFRDIAGNELAVYQFGIAVGDLSGPSR